MTTFQRNRLYRYRSPKGAIGAGFLIEFAGRPQHSVAWPDGPAQRYKDDELAELGIRCYEADPEPESTEPAAPEPADESAADSTADAAGEPDSTQFDFNPDDTEANNIREYLRVFPDAANQDVIAALNKLGMQVSSSQVSAARKQLAKLAEKGEATDTEEAQP